MSDSHKLSLLDLQTPGLSQYGKKDLDQNRGPTRNAESSYRKQLSESLSKKQSSPSIDNKTETESRSIDHPSDKKRTENDRSDSRLTDGSRENRTQLESQQAASRQEESTVSDDESQIATSASEKSTTAQESEFQNSSESIDSAEESLNTQQEINQPVKGKEPSYSLFDSTFVTQHEGELKQETTTETGEIPPPANFHFAEDQRIADLQVQVTETGSDEAIPIPEGLAELLKQQVIDTSQTVSGQEVQSVDSSSEDQEVNSALQKTVELMGLQEGEASSVDAEALLNSEDLPELKLTDDLEQVIQENQKINSGDVVDSTGENEIEVQSIIQQQSLHTRNSGQSTSSETESDNGELTLDQEAVQAISDTEIEQVSQGLKSEQAGVSEKQTRESGQAEPETNEVNQRTATLNPNIALDTQNRIQAEAAKTSSVLRENISSIDNDQPVSLQTTASQSASTSSTQANTPVAPAVDVKQIEQLVERIVATVRQTQSTGQQLKIRLSPPELGTLQIEVSLKNGEYTAKLEVQNNRVQKVINDNMAQLKESLSKSGIAIDRIEVNINTDSSEDHHSSQSEARSKSGSEFQSEQFSENSNDSDQGQDERTSVEDAAKRDEEAEQAELENPQVVRSQGVATENVEEIDVQI